MTIGTDGLALISYYYNGLNVAHCDNLACTSATHSTLTSLGGAFSSTTVGPDGMGIISHYDFSGDLVVSHCSDLPCSEATSIVLDSPGDSGLNSGGTSITIGVDGLPLISYSDQTNFNPKVLHCANLYCLPYWTRR
jgi:hypothetical protein